MVSIHELEPVLLPECERVLVEPRKRLSSMTGVHKFDMEDEARLSALTSAVSLILLRLLVSVSGIPISSSSRATSVDVIGALFAIEFLASCKLESAAVALFSGEPPDSVCSPFIEA